MSTEAQMYESARDHLAKVLSGCKSEPDNAVDRSQRGHVLGETLSAKCSLAWCSPDVSLPQLRFAARKTLVAIRARSIPVAVDEWAALSPLLVATKWADMSLTDAEAALDGMSKEKRALFAIAASLDSDDSVDQVDGQLPAICTAEHIDIASTLAIDSPDHAVADLFDMSGLVLLA